MALSNEKPKDIGTYQVLLDIAQSLKTLISDPKALEKAAKEAYALPEAEQKLAEEARARIGEYKTIVAQQEKWQASLDQQEENINIREADVEKLLKKLDETKAEQDSRQKELDTLRTRLSKWENELNQKASDIEDGKNKLVSDNAALNLRKKEVDDYEISLKAKAAQLQALAGGL